MIERLYRLTVAEIQTLPSYYDQNFHVVDEEGTEYILKIMNSSDSQNLPLMDVQTHAMSFLNQKGFPTPLVLPTITGQLMSLENIDLKKIFDIQTYCVRLFNYLPGATIKKSPVSLKLLFNVGKVAARMDQALKQMVHPNLSVLQRDEFIWNLDNTPLLESYLSVMDGDPLQDVVKSVIKQYKTCVQPKLSLFEKGTIHGDLTGQNILVQPASGSLEISGILDFGCLSMTYCVFEVAIAIMYLMLKNPNPLEVGGAVLGGWEMITPLNEAERDSLYILVLCRFCLSLVIGRYNASKHPENSEYFLTTSRNGTKILTLLWELGKLEVENKWFQDARAYSLNSL